MSPKYEDDEPGLQYLKGCPLRCSPENAHGELSMEVDVCEHVCILLYKSVILEILVARCSMRFVFKPEGIHIHIVSGSAFAFTQRFPALERSRQILPLRGGACRG